MSRNYDNWERLVGAVLRREKDRRLAYCESFSSSSSADLSSRFSFDGDVHESADLCSGNIFFSRDVKAMEYKEIIKATRNFRSASTLSGGLGYRYSVYKGWIDENYVAAVKPGSGIAVAVTVEKGRHEKGQGIAYWLEKKINLSQYRHPNLVIPIGYYADRDTRIFVNEFMASGSLDRHLFRLRAGKQRKEWKYLIMDLRNKRRLPRIMDGRLEGKYRRKEAYKVADIARQCVSQYPGSRPTMAEVVAALEKL